MLPVLPRISHYDDKDCVPKFDTKHTSVVQATYGRVINLQCKGLPQVFLLG